MAQQTFDNAVVANIQIANASIPTTVKNITIGSAIQPGVATFVGTDGSNTVQDNYITATGIKLQLSDTGSFSDTLANGASETITAILQNDTNKRLFAMPAVTIYDTNNTAGHEIPYGGSVNPNDWVFSMWIDWGDSDNNNVVHKTFIKNVSGGSKTFYYFINFRFIVEEAAL